jgi:acetyl/propionyl-CoA carboxylase alpha subunit
VQRRYAKVIEETPSPAVGPAPRTPTHCGHLAGPSVGYVNAERWNSSSAERARSGPEFYFLEFNNRLQVEHPVTECLHGIDLVVATLRRRGLPLP